MNRVFAALFVLLGLCLPAAAQDAAPFLAARLPAEKTSLYAEVDVAPLVRNLNLALHAIETERADKVAYEVGNLVGLLRELLVQQEIEPALLDHLTDLRLYFVIMPKAAPETTSHTRKTPKFDPKTGEIVPNEFDTETITDTNYNTSSVVVEMPSEELAVNSLNQVKAWFDRQRAAHPDGEGFKRVDVEVERGQMFADEKTKTTVGVFDRYFVVSDAEPKELWAALMSPAQPSLAESALYRHYVDAEVRPQGLLLVSLPTLMAQTLDRANRELDEAKKTAAATPADDNKTAGDVGNWQLAAAQQQMAVLLLLQQMLGVDGLKQAGGEMTIVATDKLLGDDVRLSVAHGAQLTPLMAELFHGSGSFQAPDFGRPEMIAVMARVRARTVYDSVLNSCRIFFPAGVAAYEQGLTASLVGFGLDLGQTLALFDSDMYAFFTLARKEMKVTVDWKFDEQTHRGQAVTELRMVTVPDITLLWGLTDPQAIQNTLATLLTHLATNPGFSTFIKTRTYQDHSVYCFGMDVAQDEVFPDGVRSFAAVVIGRYLTIGSWDHVTGLIRRMGAPQPEGDAALRAIIDKNADANFIAVVPGEFMRRMNEISAAAKDEAKTTAAKKPDGGDDEESAADMPMKIFRKTLDAIGFKIDETLAGKITASADTLRQTFDELGTKERERTGTDVITGKDTGEFYEIHYPPQPRP